MGKVFTDPSTAGYHSPGHPEAPARVLRPAALLKAGGHAVLPPDVAATEEDARLVHSPEHLAAVRDGTYSDADTPHHPGIDRIALTSLSGALSAGRSAAAGEPAFSLMRPPGHHAGKSRVAGFCYLNNLAVAVESLLRSGAAKRIAIIDVDVHHGDGTESIMSGREGVLMCSLHQVPLYPGTGLKSRGNCLNFPLPPGTAEGAYLSALELAVSAALDAKPDLLAVSAGFDTYKECPIAQLKLDKPSYRRIGRMLAETKLKRFAVLEGGYAEDLPLLIESFLTGFF